MRSLLLLVAMLPILCGAAPAPEADTAGRVAERVTALDRSTRWTQVAAIRLPFRTFHPQGMVRIGDDFYISSVEVRTLPKKLPAPQDGHAYDAGVGIGHLFKVARDGRLLADLVLGEGSIYHPGGIDYDGTSLWVPVAEYRPNSRSIVYRVSPGSMTATEAFRVDDHIGGIVHDRAAHQLVGVSWGSRRFHAWPVFGDGRVEPRSARPPVANTQSYIDYQDCHGAGPRLMLCAGVAEYRPVPGGPGLALGGLDLIDLATKRPVWQTPVALWSPSGRAMTQNPVWVEATETGLRAWFLPDDDQSTLFAYEAVTTRPPAAGPPRASPSPAAPPAGTASPRPHSAR
jgi:hypothetical protein